MITRKGLLLLSGAFSLGLISLATGSISLAALAAALGLHLAMAAAATRFPRLEGTRRLGVERLFEEDAVDVGLDVRNPGRSPALVEVSDALHSHLALEEPDARHALTLGPGEARSLRYGLVAPLRGQYEIPPTRYRLTDLGDNLAQSGTFGSSSYLTVFPKRSDLRDLPVSSRYPMGLIGEHSVSQPGQGVEFFGLRGYLPGDPMRIVNWKASARVSGDELVVNQREKETVAEVTLFLDARRITGRGTADRNPLLLGCRAAATLATLYLGRRDKLRVVAYGEGHQEIAFDQGERQLYKVLDLLAGVQPKGDEPATVAVEAVVASLRSRSPVILVSSLEDDTTVLDVASLLRGLNIPFVVFSPSPVPCVTADTPEAERRVVAEEREATLAKLRSYGARVVDLTPETNLQEALMVVGTK